MTRRKYGPGYKLDDPEIRGAFIAALERLGDIAPAAAAVGVHRATIYDHMRRDPEFVEDCERARQRLVGRALETLKLVAIDGVEETVTTGKTTRTRRRYSVPALLRLLARHNPEEWGDRVKVDQTVQADVSVTERVAPRDIPLAAREKLRDALAEIRRN